MGRFLVTGAAGFIGSHTVMKMVERGNEVVAVDSFTPYYDPSLKDRNAQFLRDNAAVSVLKFDLGADKIEPILDGIDGVLHLAGQPGVRQSWTDFDSYVRENISATSQLLAACVRSGVRRIVYASSSSVYGNAANFPVVESDPTVPFSPYGVSKLAAEHLVRAYSENFGVVSVCLRYFTVYGPRQRPDMAFAKIISSMRSKSPFELFGDGSQIRDFTYVGDVAEANISALSTPLGESKVPNISGGASASMLQVLGIFEEIRPGVLNVLQSETVAGDVLQTGGSNRLAGEVLGWTPRTDLRTGILNQVESVL